MRIFTPAGAAAVLAGLIGSASSAFAGGCVGQQCYQRVVSPPVYETATETFMVTPPKTIAHVRPAEYGAVTETVVVRPAHTVKHVVPGEVQTIAERVLVAPATRRWEVTVDAYGRTIGCWVTVPARYETRYRQVMTRAPSVAVQHVPAVLGTQQRTVMVRPATVHHKHIPARFATVSATVQVAPARAHWAPMH